MTTKRFRLLMTAAFGGLVAQPALAQDSNVPPASSAGQQVPGEAPASGQPTGQTDDVVVTAQRREQTLFEVPQSISVVSAATLERQQATSFLDYAQLVPGLSVTQTNPGESRVILRGINTGSVASTVAVYVDDIPYGSSTSLARGGQLAGDFDTFDIARVEVLRGPQGTLYGSNSLGGVIKYITAEPNFEKFEARAQAGVEMVRRGETGFFGNAMVNVPLGDTLAVRASGFYRRSPGYIDRIGLPKEDANRVNLYGGRASLLFKPTDDLSIRLFALAQDIDVGPTSTYDADPETLGSINAMTQQPLGRRQTRYALFDEKSRPRYRVYSGTLNYDFGFANLTTVTSYSTLRIPQLSDFSANGLRDIANLVYALDAPGTIGIGVSDRIGLNKFTQEVRLASPDSDSFEWLVGGYYTNEKSSLEQRVLPFTIGDPPTFLPTRFTVPAPLEPVLGPGTFEDFVFASLKAKYREYAAFGSVTAHFGDRFDLTAGGRYSHNKQNSTTFISQVGQGDLTTVGRSSEDIFTWSVSPRLELSDQASIYARVAKGYRPGGPNPVPLLAPPGFPSSYDADTLISYEAGLRGETADRTFGFDASIYYLDWKDIIVSTVVNDTNVNANGGKARSYGADVSLTMRPTGGLSVVATVAYNDAELRDDTPASTGGFKGDRLPYSPQWSGNVSADYEWIIGNGAKAFVGGNVRLVSDQGSNFDAQYQAIYGRRLEIDGYATADLRAGVEFDRINVTAYVKNLTDSFGIVNAGGISSVGTDIGGTGANFVGASTIRPRTIGATVGFGF